MNNILTDLSKLALITAIKGNLYSFFRFLSRSPLTEFYQDAKLIHWHTPVPHPWFNGVLSLQPASADENQLIQGTLLYFKLRQVSGFTWWMESNLQISDWTGQLLSQGFQYDANTPGMMVDLDTISPLVPLSSQVVLKPVEDLETLQEWVRIFIIGYEVPEIFIPTFFQLMASLGLDLPLRHYLGYLNGQPVATSTLFLASGVAGIYNVATIAEARRQGIGAALTLFPLYQARDMGYRVGVLQSSEIGFKVYQRLGFQELCIMEHFYRGLSGENE